MPEPMFVPHVSLKSGKRRSAVVAGGMQGLGLGLLSLRPKLGEVDIIDLNLSCPFWVGRL